MRMRIDVRVDSKRDRRLQILVARTLVDVGKFRFALDVEAKDMLIESVFDFFPRFAYARKRAFRRIRAGRDYAEKFAAGNDVESGSGVGEQLQNGAIGVRLNR